VWAVHVTNDANQTVADIYGRAGDGLRQNINGLPIDNRGRHGSGAAVNYAIIDARKRHLASSAAASPMSVDGFEGADAGRAADVQ